MLGYFGFSYVGCIYLLMLFIPNILWTKYKLSGYNDVVSNENKVLLVLERVGKCLSPAWQLFSIITILNRFPYGACG